MPKTGYKYTKQQPNKGTRNMLPKTNASSKVGKSRANAKPDMRSASTINRLKMYVTGKAVRNKEGKVVGGQYMMGDRAGDVEITAATGRIAPDRRWFGNTRVVGQKELEQFRSEMAESAADPYSVVLKRKKLPMGLLNDAAELEKKGGAALRDGLLRNEPFEATFGGKAQRKRVKLDQYMVSRSMPTSNDGSKTTTTNKKTDQQQQQQQQQQQPKNEYAALLATAQKSAKVYEDTNSAEGIVPWGRDSNLDQKEGEGVDWRHEKKDDLFLKGQSKRIWGEFFKVVDCSDVILHIIDARNVPGTRCTMIERHIAKNAPHKHLVFILNKIDLVPNWVAKRWVGELAKDRPTVAFHASMNQAFGKGALISLLRQFGQLMSDKKQISVGVIGYPNVGKSSVINTLISKKSCKVAPVPGETKIWQYVALFKKIHLIDCPGVVVDTAGDTEVDSVLKGVVRAERLENPEDFIDPILAKVKRAHVAAKYGLPKDGEGTWKDTTHLLELIAFKAGRLFKGGEPDRRSSAITIILDFQRGRLPHHVPPPDLKNDDDDNINDNNNNNVVSVKQDLDQIGVENMGKAHEKELEEEEGKEGRKSSSKKGKGESTTTLQVQQTGSENEEDDDDDDSSDDEDNMPSIVVAENWNDMK